jgi:hypothetical protein
MIMFRSVAGAVWAASRGDWFNHDQRRQFYPAPDASIRWFRADSVTVCRDKLSVDNLGLGVEIGRKLLTCHFALVKVSDRPLWYFQ